MVLKDCQTLAIEAKRSILNDIQAQKWGPDTGSIVSILRYIHGAMLGAALLSCLGGTAHASSIVCTVPNTVTLDILPTGCAAVLTNGPITYTGVTSSGGDIYNVEVDQLEFFSLNNSDNTVEVYLQGTDTDVTSDNVMPFAGFISNVFFETGPLNNDYSPDTGTQTFGIAHFIIGLPGGNMLKLNFGESGSTNQGSLETVQSSADNTTSPGNFTVSSFFDIYTELTLNGGVNYTVANDDYSGANNGSGAEFQAENLSPEPASAVLFAAGLAGLNLARRWKKPQLFN